MENLTGKRIDRYEILELIGKGGMAMVYKARDTRLEREVAIKIIRRNAFPPEELHEIFQRFEREAKSLARLSHPNIVRVIDYGEYEDAPFLALEYFSGGTLKQKVSGAISWQEAARLILPIARGVEYAHQRGIIHRDIKPANILITENGEPTLSDFGIAKLFQSEKTSSTLTGSGAAVGTPEYMAPEQWTGETSPKSDMYALGIVLYEMIVGRRPYIADTPGGFFLKQVTEALPFPREFVANLPEPVEFFLLKTLAKEPADRYADLGEFIKELEILLNSDDYAVAPKTKQKQTGHDAPPESEKRTKQKTAEKIAREKAEREAAKKTQSVVAQKAAPQKPFPLALIGGLGLLVIAVGVAAFMMATKSSTAKTATPTATLTSASNKTNVSAPTLGIGSTIISEKDGAALVYVPAGEFTMGNDAETALADCEKSRAEALNDYDCSLGLFADEAPRNTVTLDAFWIDKTEVTNAMYAECVADDGACAKPVDISSSNHASYYDNPEFKKYPVVYVDWHMAKAYCEWAGRRLPTEAEWEKAARGTDERPYPWGHELPNSNLLSYSEGVYIRDTAEVAQRPDGKSFYGAFDMAGNVYEWVNSAYKPYPYDANDEREDFKSVDDERVLRGGSFRNNNSDIRSANRYKVFPINVYFSVGFRCARSEQPTDAAIPPTPVSTEVQKRAETFDVGATMTGEDGATLVYVPEGEFLMGSEDGKTDEKPVHKVYLDAFWIGETEVTNKRYEACVLSGTCDVPAAFASYNQKGYYGYPQFINYPVLYVNWDQAKTYCTWAGGRLPTEAEWEKAARGTDGRTYPWGNATPNDNLLNYNSNVFDTTEVGKYPDGQSIYGAQDMAGNVWEWVSSMYKPYPYNGLDGRENMTLSTIRVLRGGSWLVSDGDVRASNRYKLDQETTFNNLIGFRCARSK